MRWLFDAHRGWPKTLPAQHSPLYRGVTAALCRFEKAIRSALFFSKVIRYTLPIMGFSQFHWGIVVLVAILASFSNGRSIYERSTNPFLYLRDIADPALPACVAPCGPGCPGPYLDNTPPNPARRRSIESIGGVQKRDFDVVVAGSSPNPQWLAKRNFYKVTEGNVDSWIKNKVDPKTTTTTQLCFAPAGKF